MLGLAVVAAAAAAWFWFDGKLPGPQIAHALPAPATIVAAPPVTIVQPAPVVQQAPDAAVDVDAMRDASLRAAREQTIRVQQRLRAEAAAQRAKKAEAKTSDVRCVEGQQLKRVPNGWVDDGKC